MKTKTIITAVILLFNVTSFAQNKEYKEYYDSGKLKLSGYMTSDEKETGEWKSYYENGKIETISNYKNGLLDGETKMYYENGKIMFIINHKNGALHGEQREYYENGNVREVRNLINGEEGGESRYFYVNGKEDHRRKELKTALEKYLAKSDDIVAITKILVEECYTSIYYTDQDEPSERMIEMPMNLKGIDKDGIISFNAYKKDYDTFDIKFDGDRVEYFLKKNGQYYSFMVSGSLSFFSIKKEGRKKVEELMRSISEDCKE